MNRTIIPTPPHKRSRRVIYAGRLSTSQDGIVVSPHGIAPCHTAGHGNCPKILIEYEQNETTITL
jgi:hypothetical protein